MFAQGNVEISAPRIAGLDASYIGRQLSSFRAGRRGASAGDTYGAQMAQIAAGLDDEAIGRLSAYISAMPEVAPLSSAAGDAKEGAATYATCAACHGANGEGGASMGAPRLSGMTDWYLVRQIGAFKSGARGAAAGDDAGAAMRAIAATLAEEKSVRDVVAYAVALPGSVKPNAACADKTAGACGSSR